MKYPILKSVFLFMTLFCAACILCAEEPVPQEIRELRAQNKLLKSTIQRQKKKIAELEGKIKTIELGTKKDTAKLTPEPKKPNLKPCSVCRGTKIVKCPECNGSGNVKCSHIDSEGKKHAKWYEICKKCNGKGKIPYRHKKEIKCLSSGGVWITKKKWVTEYRPCSASDCFSVTNRHHKKIYVTWICPHCSGNQYKGYVKCTKCNGTGKIKCEACKGTGKTISVKCK